MRSLFGRKNANITADVRFFKEKFGFKRIRCPPYMDTWMRWS